MSPQTRRHFLRQSILATAGLGLLACGSENDRPPETMANKETPAAARPLPYLDTIGLQLYTVRTALEADPRTTLQTLAEMGYRQVEAMDTRQLAIVKPLCDEFGLGINSTFMLWSTVTGRWDLVPEEDDTLTLDQQIDQAGEAGCSHMVFGYFQPEARQTADDWKRVADALNQAGDRAQSQGLQLAYHNHNFEWDPVDGTTGFDILLDRLDGQLVPFELDVFWAQIAGQDPRAVLGRIADRVELLHLKQLKPATAPVTTLEEVPEDAFEELPNGDIPIKDLMRLGRDLGVKYCMVEQDKNWAGGDALRSARESIEFLG